MERLQQPPPFIEIPGLLMLFLLSRCNERCRFCMVEEQIRRADDLAFETAAERILAQPAGTRVEFFGGEPTLYPRFLDLLALARGRDLTCSIASNCRTFHSRAYTSKVAALGPEGVYVRTSLYGDTAALHDYYTLSPGSYAQTVRGIGNLVQAGFRTQVNVVIMARNVERLTAIAELVAGWGVPRIKFGNLVGIASCQEHVVRLSLVAPHLRAAIAAAEGLGLTVTVEKTPACVAGGRLDLMSTERRIGGWLRNYDAQGACAGCLVSRWCEGFDPDYVELFGYDGAEPLSRVPRAALERAGGDEPEFLKIHCVSITDEAPDEATAEILTELLSRVEAKYGLLAVFPERYIA